MKNSNNPFSFSFTTMILRVCFFLAIIFALLSCKEPGRKIPENIYITWGAHDQLSDSVKLTEELTNKELDAYLALRGHGVKLDYFLMDMFWFSKHNLYRTFNEDWKNGHKAFFKKAKDNDVKLGLWLSANVLGWNENMQRLPGYAGQWYRERKTLDGLV